MRPPRSLWVPFPLGRPLGPPGAREFQTDVLRSLLGLFEMQQPEDGSIIVDYPREAPESGEGEVWACPVSLPQPEQTSEKGVLQTSLDREVELLLPWYEEARRGKLAVGVSGLGVKDVTLLTKLLVQYAFSEKVEVPAGAAWPMPALVKYVADDLKSIYSEATAFQKADDERRVNTNPYALQHWLFGETVLGETLYRVAQRFRESNDKATRELELFLIPTGLERR